MNTEKIREALESGIIELGLRKTALAELDKAQQPAEPVAWMVKTRIGVEWVTTLAITETGARQMAIERYRNGSDVQHMEPIPLYPHPPQAQQPGKVLTDEEIEHIADVEHVDSGNRMSGMWRDGFVEGLRHARDHYGIGAPAAGLTDEEIERIARYEFRRVSDQDGLHDDNADKRDAFADGLRYARDNYGIGTPAAGLTVDEVMDVMDEWTGDKPDSFRSRLTAVIEAKSKTGT